MVHYQVNDNTLTITIQLEDGAISAPTVLEEAFHCIIVHTSPSDLSDEDIQHRLDLALQRAWAAVPDAPVPGSGDEAVLAFVERLRDGSG